MATNKVLWRHSQAYWFILCRGCYGGGVWWVIYWWYRAIAQTVRHTAWLFTEKVCWCCTKRPFHGSEANACVTLSSLSLGFTVPVPQAWEGKISWMLTAEYDKKRTAWGPEGEGLQSSLDTEFLRWRWTFQAHNLAFPLMGFFTFGKRNPILTHYDKYVKPYYYLLSCCQSQVNQDLRKEGEKDFVNLPSTLI